jgi:hypothetical protein
MSTVNYDLRRLLSPVEIHDGRSPILALLVTLFIGLTYISFLSRSSDREFWNALPWAGVQNHLLPRTRAGFNAIRQTRGIVEEGYKKVCRNPHSSNGKSSNSNTLQYSKNGIPFVLPKFGSNPVVVLPPSQVRELVRKPDDEVDLHIIHWEQLANHYTSRPEVFLNPIHLSVVKRQITRKLPTFSDDLYREMAAAFASDWVNEDGSSKEIAVYRSCIKIVSRAANRVLSGVELCRYLSMEM